MSLQVFQIFLLHFLVSFIPATRGNSTVYYYIVDHHNNNNRAATWNPHRINKKDSNSHVIASTVDLKDYTSGYYDNTQYNSQNSYPLYPSSTFTHHHYGQSPGYYFPGYSNGNGWSSNGGQGGKMNNPFDLLGRFNLEEIMDNLVYSPIAQMMGFKGTDGGSIVKFGVYITIAIPLLLLVTVPLILLVTVPLSALIVILILTIPFPVEYKSYKDHAAFRSLKNSTTEFVTRAFLSGDECVEKLSCQIAHRYGRESWIGRITNDLPNLVKFSFKNNNVLSSLREKISRGFSNSSEPKVTSSCVHFSCDPVRSLKKVLKI